MPAAAQQNIRIFFNQEKETVVSGNPSLEDIAVSLYNLALHFFDPQGWMMGIT